jgi:hypothetical protein
VLLYAAVTLGGLAFGGAFPQIVIATSELLMNEARGRKPDVHERST